MDNKDAISTVLLLCAILPLVFRLYASYSSSYIPLPPGPTGDPFIGHVRCVPQSFAWLTFTDWMEKFGDVVYIHAFGKPIVILNSYVAAKEILEKRSVNYVDRPRFVVQQEMMGLNRIVIFARYGERFKKLRRMIRQPFSTQNSMSFHTMQRREAHILLNNILNVPDMYESHIERAVSGSIMMTAYGHQINSNEDEFVHLGKAVTELIVAAGTAGAALVDFIPILRFIPSWMPGAGFKRHAEKTREMADVATSRPFNMVQNRRESGKNILSLADLLLDEHEQNGIVNHVDALAIEDATGALYGAAVETTITVLRTFLLGIVTHSEVAKKAQEEIDRVIGNERLPDFEDRYSLPYINCVLKETYRWNPALPLGIPHGSLHADEYQGMRIPRGSTVIANIWAMMMDASLYEEPKEFNPDRFLERCADPEAARKSGYIEFDPESKVFGFGGRICPGRFYADAGLWLTMACLLAAFEILPPIGDDGKEEIPAVKFTSGLTSQPVPFQCRFILRKESYAPLIKSFVTKPNEEVI